MKFDWSTILNFEDVLEWLTRSGIRVLVILVGAFVVIKLLGFVTRRIERFFDDDDPTTMNEREKQAATLGKVMRNIIRVLVWGVAGMMVLKEIGLDIAPILAGVGIAGLAIGFGAQSVVKDFLAGMFVLVENQYNVGDVIKAAGVAGLVERITLRATTLRDLEGRVHIIPNGVIDVVTNMTKEWSRFVLDIGVAYKEDVDRVMRVLKEVGDELAEDAEFGRMITAPFEVLGVQDFADSAVVIRVSLTTIPIRQWTIGREYRRRVKNAFDAQNIEIPFPHTTIYLGEGDPMRGRLTVELSGEKTGAGT
ncbi:MAG: mechanosensitive ion channel family protein [Candidatus Eisenbacteria bacterium]